MLEDSHVNLLIGLGCNALCGLVLFEWAWYKTRRFRNPILELNAQFPELARHDAPKWRKWKLYPGAITLLVPRILLIMVLGLILGILLNLWLVCHDRARPITGCRRVLCRGTLKICVNLMGIFGWFTYFGYEYVSQERVNFYEEYLGSVQDQRRWQTSKNASHPEIPKRGPGPSSTVVCNHIGLVEILNQVCSPLHPSFTPKAGLKAIPIFRGIAESLQSIFVERAGTEAERNRVV